MIPGIIASLGLGFATYLVVDRGMQPVASLKESWRITKGNKWRIFLLGLALTGVNILGALALVVGLLGVGSDHACSRSCTPTATCWRRPAPAPA